MNEKWFLLTIDQIEKKLKTNAASGLSRKAARSACHRVRSKAGSLFFRTEKSLIGMVAEILSDFSLVILLICAALAIFLSETILGATVLGICLINLVVSLIYYRNAHRTMEKIEHYFLPAAKVIRGGKLYNVSFDNVVPGDVILLEQGDIVCADARLVVSDSLLVSMRIDKNQYLDIKKLSNGVVDPSEKNPRKLSNIVHGGSIIKQGSARAIVYATGKYTYLGALTGGINESYSDNTPLELKRLRRACSKINLFLMLGILPVTFLSLLFSHLWGGNATLSNTFLTVLAIATASMSQLACTLCKIFFVNKIKVALNEKNPVAIRTAYAFDKLHDLKHIVMLDGCAVTDGVLHFNTAFNFDGELKQGTSVSLAQKRLFEYAALYSIAENEMLTVGLNAPERFKSGFEELVQLANVDVDALKIRCTIRSYITSTTSDGSDKIFFEDSGRRLVLSISYSSDIISNCINTVSSNSTIPLTTVGADRIRHIFNTHTNGGSKVLLFSLATLENDINNSDRCFIGGIIFSEAVDSTAYETIRRLKLNGINVISILNSEYCCRVDIPKSLLGSNAITKADLIKNNLPISYDFGKIDTYINFSINDICALIKYAHSKNEKVGVIAFSNDAQEIIDQADLFISCAPIVNTLSAQDERELFTLEKVGTGYSSSCEQVTKKRADIIIPRPNGECGGMSAILNAVYHSVSARENLARFFRYLLTVQLLRTVITLVPMIFGITILDARHILLLSIVFDLPMLLMFANRKSPRKMTFSNTLIDIKLQARKCIKLIAVAATSGMIAIVLPFVLDITGILGPFIYRTEFIFLSTVLLHILITCYLGFGGIKYISNAVRNKFFVSSSLIGIVLFAVFICFNRVGMIFDCEHLPISYLLLSIIPCAYVILILKILQSKKSKNI